MISKLFASSRKEKAAKLNKKLLNHLTKIAKNAADLDRMGYLMCADQIVSEVQEGKLKRKEYKLLINSSVEQFKWYVIQNMRHAFYTAPERIDYNRRCKIIEEITPSGKIDPNITLGLKGGFMKGDIVFLGDETGGLFYTEIYGDRLGN